MYMMMAGRLHQVDKGAASGGWWVRGQAMITVRHHGQAAAGAGRVIISSWGGPANNIIMLVLQHYHYNYYCSMNGRVTHCSRMASSVKGRGVPLMSFLAGSCSTSPWKYDTASWMSASARLLHGQWCCSHMPLPPPPPGAACILMIRIRKGISANLGVGICGAGRLSGSATATCPPCALCHMPPSATAMCPSSASERSVPHAPLLGAAVQQPHAPSAHRQLSGRHGRAGAYMHACMG